MTDTPPEGWFPDPMGRSEERFWDGSEWTARVRDAGVERDDPLAGAGPGASEAAHAPVTASGDPLRSGPAKPGLAAHLRRDRPPIDVAAAVSVAAGAIGVLGSYALVAESDGTAGVAIISILLLAAAYALALVGPAVTRGASIVAAVIAPIGLFGVVLGDGLDGRTAVVVPALLLALTWAAMFVLPGLRGAPVLIATSAVAIWTALVVLIASDDPYGTGIFGAQAYDDSVLVPGYDPWQAITGTARSVGAFTLLFALVAALAAAILDRRGWHVAATPALAVAVPLGWVGLYLSAFGVQSAPGNSFLVAVTGVVLAVVGGLGARRGSTWIGVALATSGLASLLVDGIEDPVPAGIVLLAAAAGLLAAAGPVARRLAAATPG